MTTAMVADVARDAADTGLRHGASCYSASNITLKLAMGATGINDLAIRIVYGLPSVVAGVSGLLVLGWQPIRRNHSISRTSLMS